MSFWKNLFGRLEFEKDSSGMTLRGPNNGHEASFPKIISIIPKEISCLY